MSTLWLKIAVISAIIIGAFILVSVLAPVEEKPQQQEKSYHEVIEEDDRRLRAEPEVEKQPEPEAEPAKPTFRELSLEEQVQAGKLFEMALLYRKQGRLPGMRSYKLMVDYCRQLIREYPGTVYSYKAKRMLGDLRPRDRERYGITDEETDLSSY